MANHGDFYRELFVELQNSDQEYEESIRVQPLSQKRKRYYKKNRLRFQAWGVMKFLRKKGLLENEDG